MKVYIVTGVGKTGNKIIGVYADKQTATHVACEKTNAETWCNVICQEVQK